MKIVSNITDATIRFFVCISAGYLMGKGYMDSKLRVSLEDVGKGNCLPLTVFYSIAILWACELLMQLSTSEDRLAWDIHLHHFMAVIAYALFVDGTSSVHRNNVLAGSAAILIFGAGLYGFHCLARFFF